MSAEQEMQQIKGRIAEVYARRERLKQALADGALAPRAGLAQLEAVDRELSDLDSRYKALWDAAHPRPTVALHPAEFGALRAGELGDSHGLGHDAAQPVPPSDSRT